MADYPYNLTGMGSSDNIYALATSSNTLTNGLFGVLILVSLYIILFLAFKRFDSARALAAASYITAIAAILLRLMGWISDAYMFGCFLIAAIAFVVMRFND